MATSRQDPREQGRSQDVLRVLRDEGRPLTIAEVAERLAIHANTARFHLATLASRGQIERAAASVAAGPTPKRRAQAAGHAWGQRAAAASGAHPASEIGSMGRLLGMLDEFGFDPAQIPVARAVDGASLPLIGLRNCPFLELAVDHADVVCPIHLGLMQGAAEAWEAPFAVNELTPFVEPGLCLARVESRTR